MRRDGHEKRPSDLAAEDRLGHHTKPRRELPPLVLHLDMPVRLIVDADVEVAGSAARDEVHIASIRLGANRSSSGPSAARALDAEPEPPLVAHASARL